MLANKSELPFFDSPDLTPALYRQLQPKPAHKFVRAKDMLTWHRLHCAEAREPDLAHTQMRLLRAFRLLRVFKKIRELHKIVIAVTMSILPAIQALVLVQLYAYYVLLYANELYALRND